MHQQASLLNKLYTSLDQKNHVGMIDCYHPDAEFKDIAFDLRGKKQIHAMWHMISQTDLRASFKILRVDDQIGSVELVDDYTFGDTGRRVHNVIRSDVRFRDGLIIQHHDTCDALKWGLQALGPARGVMAWLVPAIRRARAKKKIDAFIESHPEYQ
jgi:ketosteroid isomerase-like protein